MLLPGRAAPLLLALLAALAACAPSRSTKVPVRAAEVTLRGLRLAGDVLEGEIVCRSPTRSALEVWLEVSLRRPGGDAVLTRRLRAVPGGDGRPLAPGFVKHFRYHLAVRAARDLTVSGRIVQVVWSP
jgi:hypothetical protein